MAKEDLERLFKKREQYIPIITYLKKILKELENYQIPLKIKYSIEEYIQNLESEIKMLEKHSLCTHFIIKEGVLDGNDSHKDYYKDVCDSCGKVIKQYSV